MRNLELLRDVECIEISMKEYSPDHGPLQQQKVHAQFVHRSSFSHCGLVLNTRTEVDPGLIIINSFITF